MKLGDEGYDWFDELNKLAIDNQEHLSEWQQDFITDFGAKAANFDAGTFISEKQLAQLNKIAEALGVDQLTEDKLNDD